MPAFRDLIGETFGRLTVEARGEKNRWGGYRWVCRCKCTNVITVDSNNLRRGLTTSCGCYRNDRVRETCGTHGQTNSTEYWSWSHMKRRCTDPSHPRYADWGGRGITVCDRWRDSFEVFLADMGPKPSLEHSIDRKDNGGNYEPGNCRWAIAKEQSRNTRRNHMLTYNGETRCVSEWSEATGINHQTIHERLKRGLSVADALGMPPS